MPAIPSTPHAPPAGNGGSGGSSSTPMPSVKPAPAIVDVQSHQECHVLPRRFLGPMPKSVLTNSVAVAKRRHLRQLRRRTMDALVGEEENEHLRERHRTRTAARTFRVSGGGWMDKNRGRDQEIQIESDTSDSDEDVKGSKRRDPLQTWVGDSFDIGREFENVQGHGNPDPAVVGEDPHPDDKPDTLQDVANRVLDDGPTTEEPAATNEEIAEMFDDSPPDTPTAAVPERVPQSLGPFTADQEPHSTAPSTAAASFITARTDARPSTTERRDSASGATFVTAKTDLATDSDTSSTFTARVPRRAPQPPPSASLNSSPRVVGSSQASSTRPLYGGSSDEDHDEPPEIELPSQHHSPPPHGSSADTARLAPRRLKSALRGNQSDNESPAIPQQKTVQFPPNPVAGGEDPRNGDQNPADPREVLARAGSQIEGTSADTTPDAVGDWEEFLPGGLVMRDRVLVKVGRHRDENLSHFDERTELRNPCYRFDPLEEYVFAMTPTMVEFYTDWSWRLQEYYKGTKQLRFSIPLTPVTNIAIFDQTDMTLSLVCPWPSIVRQTARSQDPELRKLTSSWDRARHSSIADRFGMDRQGCAVFIIKFSERSRALDWLFYINEQLGNRLPMQMDISVPAIETTMRTNLPASASSETFNVRTALDSIWKAILADSEQVRLLRELPEIPQLQLAWKGSDATLDWVAYNTTVTGKPRDWALLASFAHCHTVRGHRILQARRALHHAVRVRLEDGTTLDEPAGIEGYLTRHKVGGMPKDTVYLSVNDGHLFVSLMINALPPLRPGKAGSSPSALFPKVHQRFLTTEHRRMSRFVEKCEGCFSLSEIESVQLVEHVEPFAPILPEAVQGPSAPALTESPPSTSQPQSPSTPRATTFTQSSPQSTSQPASPSTPRATTFAHRSHPSSPLKPKRARGMSSASRMSSNSLQPVKKTGKLKQREFTMTLRGGLTIRFEAHSPEIAAEWVEHLSQLIKYWTLRPRVDARGAMDTVQAHNVAGAFMGKVLDLEVEQTLNNIWNWCIIDGCRAITHSSPIYVRESAWGKFRAMYLVLTGGSLVLFRVKGKTSLQTRKRVYPLFGSYVFSGRMALDELDDNVNDKLFDPKARIYSDGLQTTDGVEATTFCVRLTWPIGRFANPQPWATDNDSGEDEKPKGKKGRKGKQFVAPRLNENPTMLFCRARSQLERDRWVWAINCEMERYARSHVREVQELREYGTLPRHTTVTRG